MSIDTLFQRQTTLGIQRFNNCIIVGCGGVGSWAALFAALSGGFSNVILIDDDCIELTNLNRTPFRICDIGNYKVDIVKELILERRCSCDVHTYRNRTTPDLIRSIVDEFDIGRFTNNVLIDCRDDLYSDFNNVKFSKRYKLGYDGFSITIDPKPNETFVHGFSNGYTSISSFISPAVMVAVLCISDIFNYDSHDSTNENSSAGSNSLLTIDSNKILETLRKGTSYGS